MQLFKKQENGIFSLKELKKFKLLKDLSKSELKQLSGFLEERRYKPGEVLFKSGYPHAVLFFVAEGEVEIYLEKDNEEIKLVKKEKNEHFGEVGLFIEIDRTANARSDGESRLLALSKKNFNDFVRLNPRGGVKILRIISSILCQQMIENNKRLKELTSEPDKEETQI